MHSREYTLASLADLREALLQIQRRGRSLRQQARAFTFSVDAILSIAPIDEKPWVLARLEEIRQDFSLPLPPAIMSSVNDR